MNEKELYCFLGGAILVLAVLILWITVIIPGTNRWNKRFITAMFAVFTLFILSCIVDLVVYADPDMATAERIASYLEYLLLSIPIPMFTAYLLHTCDGYGRPGAGAGAGCADLATAAEDWRKSPLIRAAAALWGIYFLLLGIAQCTTFLYYFTADNLYIRGPWHPLLMFPVIAMMFLNLVAVIQRRNKLPGKYYSAFLIHLLPLTIALLVHTVIYSSVLVILCICVSMLSMFVIILYDQIGQYVGQQREIAHQRASIMVLQMRPHFIYNAMMSIYYLCAQDPKKAQQVTLDFTAYLRKNFTAIVSEETVPFTDELEHTRAYLAVEQVQFEDGLFVNFDTPYKKFRVPPLTLQPLVENAVKHGMDPEAAPLHISIRTEETEAGSEIIVEDDGPGFAPGDKPHTALENIRQRLEMMCGGKMKIRPRNGGGTVVNVTIPRVE